MRALWILPQRLSHHDCTSSAVCVQLIDALQLTADERSATARQFQAFAATLAALRSQQAAMLAQLTATYTPSGSALHVLLQQPWAQASAYLAGSAALEAMQQCLKRENEAFMELCDAVVARVRQHHLYRLVCLTAHCAVSLAPQHI